MTDRMSDVGESASGAPKQKRFELLKWTGVATWKWDTITEDCAICRNNVMEQCIECQANQKGTTNEGCVVAWGTCGHGFHHHCISRWLKARGVCPLDNKEWEFAKYGQ